MSERFQHRVKNIIHHPLTLSLYAPAFLLSFALGLLSAVTPIYLLSFGVDYGLVGVMLSMETVGKMIFTLPGGVIIPRLGARNSMAIGVILVAFSVGAMWLVQSAWMVVLARLAAGAGESFYNTARLSYAASATSSQNRGRSLSVVGATNRLSSIVSPTLGGLLAVWLGLRLPYLVSSILILLTAILIFASLKPQDSPVRATTTSLKQLLQVARANGKILARAGSGAILLSTVRQARVVFIPLFASEVLHLDASQAGLILSAASVVDLMNFYLAGVVMDRYGRRWAGIPCVGIMAIGMAIIPFTTGFWGLIAASIIIGFGNGFGTGIMMIMGSDLAPPQHREEFLAIWLLMLDVGGAACPLVVGAISDLLSLTASGFAFFGIGMVGVLFFLLVVPETRDFYAEKQKIIPAAH